VEHREAEKMTTARSEQALQGWLDELPALVPALEQDAGVRGMLLGDAVLTGDTLLRAAEKARPVVRGRAHLAVAALDLTLAYDGDNRARRLSQVADHAERAADIAQSVVAPFVRVSLLPPAMALMAGCLPLTAKSKAPALERRVVELAGAIGAALTEQATEARRGIASLAAAMTLADGVKLVRQASAKAAILERAHALATDARVALIRAGELAKAEAAAEVAEGLEARLPR
jgi:hypothetical protein